jgi:primosomal protein N' (replication factor Y)
VTAPRYARVTVPRPLYQSFLYRIPQSLAGEIGAGSRVVVPFGRSQLTGWVDELVAEPGELPAGIREITDAPDSEPVFDRALLELCRWVARYYVAPFGLTLRAALPARLTAESAERLARSPGTVAEPLTQSERALLDYVEGCKRPPKLSGARKALGPGPWARTARALADKGLLEIARESPAVQQRLRTRQVIGLTGELASLQERDRIFSRTARQRALYEYLETVGGRAEVAHVADQLGISRSVVQGLVDKGVAELHAEQMPEDPFANLPIDTATHIPTDAQALAIHRLSEAARGERPGVFVLKGVTGSGKTLVYIEVLRELVQRRGRGAILLVPEISLTPQTLSRFRAAFGDDVALLHSALSDGERFAAWHALRTGVKRIVIGARSAVFAPCRDLGAIIIDEEQEDSYKQADPAPRYHAREVAVMRAHRAGALCVLGSATPSLESWSNVKARKWELIELPERIGARPLPQVQIVDLREERKSRAGTDGKPVSGPLVLSASLENALADRLRRGEQVILLLNRRGYTNFTQCRDCGAVRNCPACNVSLTQHRRPPRLVCHHCNHQEAVPEACTECGSTNLSHRGVGTEQVERILGETFAAARIARMDVDTTSAKWSHHEILGRVERREVDVLLGTQMIAKGLDFPNVTLVGVINADVGLNIPDFRASERTFQLLTQVAGRAGRGPAGGDVIVQTSLPGHYAVSYAIQHDYVGFAERELAERAGPVYPPHTRLANLVISGGNETRVQETAEAALDWLNGLLAARAITDVDLLGPAPCPIDRIRRRWRWHLLLKSPDTAALGRVLSYFAARFDRPAGDLRLEIDRDPTNLL